MNNRLINIVLTILALACAAPHVFFGCSSGVPNFRPLDSLLESEVSPEFSKENAVILFQEDRMEILGSTAIHEQRFVKKILKSELPEESIFAVSSEKYRKILSIDARAIYPDGRETVLSAKDIKILPDFEEFILYADTKKHMFRFAGAQSGTVIEVLVRKKIDNLLYWEPAVFQGNIPIQKQRYVLIHPRDFHFSIRGLGMSERPDSSTVLKDGRTRLVWERRNISAFTSENMMPPSAGYLPMIWFLVHSDLELGVPLRLDSWVDIVKWYKELSAKSLEPGPGIKTLVNTVCAPGMSEEEKARRIFNRVQEQIRYVAIYLGLGGYLPHKTEETLRNRYGDCKDQAVVLASALREAGIRAYLTIVRTADLGRFDPDIPFPMYFNHAIVASEVNGNTVFLDPTCETCSFGALPYNVQNAHALIIRDGERELITLPASPARPNIFDVSTTVEIDDEGKGTFASKIACDGFYAAAVRRAFIHRGGKGEHQVAAAMFTGNIPGATIDGLNIEGIRSNSDSLTVTVRCTVPGMLDTERTVSFIPTVFKPLDFELPNCKDRSYPIVLGKPKVSRYELSMTLPADWRVLDMPSPGSVTGDCFEYSYEWHADGAQLKFSRKWSLEDCVVAATDCDNVRNQLEAILKNENMKIAVGRD